MDEIEILRGAKVRITTETIEVEGERTSVAAIADFAMVEADHTIRLLPRVLFVLGPLLASALYFFLGWVTRSAAAGLAIIAVGAFLWRDSWLHQVTARFGDGASTTLYRTSKKGDALLFHAAIQKAKELRELQEAEALARGQ